MPGLGRVRASFDPRRWQIAAAPRRLVTVLLSVEAVSFSLLAYTVLTRSFTLHLVLVTGFLAVLAVGFEEAMARAARLQFRLASDLKRDLTSVWAVAGAAALQPQAAVCLLAIIATYTWFRQGRPAGDQVYRKTFNFANHAASCLTAAYLGIAVRPHLGALPWGLADSITAVAVLAAFAVTNRLIITCGLVTLGVRGRDLLGTRDDNLSELAALCLGGLVSLAVLHQPVLALLVIAPMVTLQRSAVLRQLETAATTDSKTGLLNAVAWEELASRELSRGAREGNEVSVLIVDVDHFKGVNDRHGHLVGDRVLQLIGTTMSGELREFDHVARFGGEEFVAVLPKAGTAEALVVAERLRSRINEMTISTVVADVAPEMDDRIAVSIGLATAPSDGVEVSDLLHAADAALYRAKAEGRNRVVLANTDPGEGRPTLFAV